MEEFGTLWGDWFRDQKLEPHIPTAITNVRDGMLALQLVLDGQAIGLGVTEFLGAEFSSGRLEPLFELRASEASAYYLVTPKKGLRNRELAAFRSWIDEELVRPY